MLNLPGTHPSNPELQLSYCRLYILSVLDIKLKTWYISIANLSCLRPHMLLFPSLFQRRTLFA